MKMGTLLVIVSLVRVPLEGTICTAAEGVTATCPVAIVSEVLLLTVVGAAISYFLASRPAQHGAVRRPRTNRERGDTCIGRSGSELNRHFQRGMRHIRNSCTK